MVDRQGYFTDTDPLVLRAYEIIGAEESSLVAKAARLARNITTDLSGVLVRSALRSVSEVLSQMSPGRMYTLGMGKAWGNILVAGFYVRASAANRRRWFLEFSNVNLAFLSWVGGTLSQGLSRDRWSRYLINSVGPMARSAIGLASFVAGTAVAVSPSPELGPWNQWFVGMIMSSVAIEIWQRSIGVTSKVVGAAVDRSLDIARVNRQTTRGDVQRTVEAALSSYAAIAGLSCSAFSFSVGWIVSEAKKSFDIELDGNANTAAWLFAGSGLAGVLIVTVVGLYKSGAPQAAAKKAAELFRYWFGNVTLPEAASFNGIEGNVRFQELLAETSEWMQQFRGGSVLEQGARAEIKQLMLDPSTKSVSVDVAVRRMVADYFDDLDGAPAEAQAVVAALVTDQDKREPVEPQAKPRVQPASRDPRAVESAEGVERLALAALELSKSPRISSSERQELVQVARYFGLPLPPSWDREDFDPERLRTLLFEAREILPYGKNPLFDKAEERIHRLTWESSRGVEGGAQGLLALMVGALGLFSSPTDFGAILQQRGGVLRGQVALGNEAQMVQYQQAGEPLGSGVDGVAVPVTREGGAGVTVFKVHAQERS